MLARQGQRLAPVPCLHRAVAKGFQEVVEQPHIEFAVFDNENGFGHVPLLLAALPIEGASWPRATQIAHGP